MFHPGLYGQIDHGFFFPVIKSGHPCHITQAVEHLYLLNHFGWQVFRGYLRVVGEELFPVDQDFLDLFSVDGDFSFTVHFHAGHLFQQVFQYGTFCRFIRVGIVFDGIVSHHDFGCLTDDNGFSQLNSSVTQCQLAQFDRICFSRDTYGLV